MKTISESTPALLTSVLTQKCPRCRRGDLFTHPNPYKLKTMMDMPDNCPVCGQPLELQKGFYFGTGYVSYGLSVAFTAMCFVVWFLTFGISISDNSIFIWLTVNALLLIALQPILQRLSRSIWITCFVKYDPDWSASVVHHNDKGKLIIR